MHPKKNKQFKFLSLCYHYIRKDNNKFPRILGNSESDFRKHLKFLKNKFKILSLEEVLDFYYKGCIPRGSKPGMLITFDDGLSDHYLAAKILRENKVKGVFFLPTCILKDRLPANPTIIHYCIAEFGIGNFLQSYENALKYNRLALSKHKIIFQKGLGNPDETIKKIKHTFKYKFNHILSRKILLRIYKQLMLKKYPNAMNLMHLDKKQVKKMLKMGHSVGVHTHTHISVGSCNLSKKDFEKEIIYPGKVIKNELKISARSLSYPFGDVKDCLDAENFLKKTKRYALAFTVKEISNNINTSPFELGRYMPLSTDNTQKLDSVLNCMLKRSSS